MCIIIYRKENNPAIPDSYLINSADNNPDGFGVIYQKDGKLMIEKTLQMSEAKGIVRRLENENRKFLAHYRYATHGEVNLDNCHPFEISGVGALVHNGVLSNQILLKEYSDTWHFSRELEEYHRKVQQNALDVTKKFLRQNTKVIGESKVAVMLNNGKVHIHNFDLGYTESGIWYSNEYSLEAVRWYSTGSGYGSYKSFSNNTKDFDYADYSVWNEEYDEYEIIDRIYLKGFEGVTDDELLSLTPYNLAMVFEQFPRECAEILSQND